MTNAGLIRYLILLMPLTGAASAAGIQPSCLAGEVIPLKDVSPDLVIDADSGKWNMRKKILQLDGDVRLRQNEQELDADRIRYHQQQGKVTAEGNVSFRQPGYEISTDRAVYQVDSEMITMDDSSTYRMIESGGYGQSKQAKVRFNGISDFSDITYTTCPPDAVAWHIRAERMEIDRPGELAKAYNARLKLGKMTVLRTPVFEFSLADEVRKTGFLSPSLRYSSKTGAELTTPFYLNLAPNYDATLYPRITSERGAIFGAEFRYLTSQHSGMFEGEVAPWDDEYTGDNDTRYAWRYRHKASFSPHLYGRIDFSAASDNDYFDDYSNRFRVASDLYAKRFATLEYRDTFWNASIDVVDYEPIDETASTPYRTLPELSFNWFKYHGNLLFTALNASYVQYDIDRERLPAGTRLDLHPAVGLHLAKPWGYTRATISSRYTDYSLDKIGANPDIAESSNRTTSTVTLDGGLTFERQARLFGSDTLQTLEPRLFYTYTPYEAQDHLPVFDSKLAEFSYENLFRENRFTGADRVGDSNQLVAALSSRLISPEDGRTLLRASIAEIFYFDDHEVMLPGSETVITDDNAVVASLFSQLDSYWSVEATTQFSGGLDTLQQTHFGINYHDFDKNRYLSLSKRTREDVPEGQQILDYTTLSVSWPFSDKVNFIGNLHYSFEQDRYLDVAAGLEYDSCCWAIRGMFGRRADDETTATDAEEIYDETFYLQLVLKGLGGQETGGFHKRVTPRVSSHHHFENY